MTHDLGLQGSYQVLEKTETVAIKDNVSNVKKANYKK